MNTYEFWNDMDKIFDAIVAYQEKTIEFNKQFVNPWIKLGKVFDKQETNDAVVAHKNAVEIDPENPQNWHELASAYTRAGNFDRAIEAYQKAIELGFESGELYKNLALAHVMIGQYKASIAIFQKSLELLEKDEEKAVVWNHLGNVYRKVDDYEMALQAFQRADQYEHKVQVETVVSPEDLTGEVVVSTDEPDASQLTDEPVPVIGDVSTPEEVVAALEDEETTFNDEGPEIELNEQQEEVEEYVDEADGETDKDEDEDEDDNDMPVILELDFSQDSPNVVTKETYYAGEQPGTAFLVALEKEAAEEPFQAETINEDPGLEIMDEPEVSLEALAAGEKAPEPVQQVVSMEDTTEDEQAIEPEERLSFAIAHNSADLAEDEAEDGLEEDESDAEDHEFDTSDGEGEEVDVAPVYAAVSLTENQLVEKAFVENEEDSEIVEEVESARENETTPVFLAYGEYLKDNGDPDSIGMSESEPEETQTIAMAPAEVEATDSNVSMDVNTDQTVEMDIKNAHVWNELGNVYFNAGSFDDAIAAYNKAIELDKKFAWPYTNLALSYVQNGRLEEAISLYQRSIELFSNESDKAVTWNRLGNVYRRLNDYENAIAAYQRADELDPSSIAKQQARFSLLGSEKVGQEVGYSV